MLPMPTRVSQGFNLDPGTPADGALLDLHLLLLAYCLLADCPVVG